MICSSHTLLRPELTPYLFNPHQIEDESIHLQQVCRLATIDRPRSSAVKFDETALAYCDVRFARRGFGGLHETSEVKIGVQVLWDGSLAAGCGGSMDIREEICGFEE